MNCFDSYCRQIIRPPRRQYMISDLGPRIRLIQQKQLVRIDFTFESRNLKLAASYFISKSLQHRCLIYLHGNASCRLEGVQYAEILASWDVNICVIDFAGCGMSEGDFISMGYFESQDIISLMKYIELNFGKVDEFILWGRSMGAVTALLLTNQQKINHYIIDSAFSNFTTLLYDIGNRLFGLFSFVLYIAIPLLRRRILSQVQFDIYELNPIENVTQKNLDKKFFFIAGKSDTLMSYQHTIRLYEACNMYKKLDICEGDHNSTRPQTTLQRIIEFINENQSNINNLEYQTKCETYFKIYSYSQFNSDDEEDVKINFPYQDTTKSPPQQDEIVQ